MQRRIARRSVALAIVAGLLVTGGASARADVCSECGPPTLEDLQQDPDFELEERFQGVRDEVYLHAGECRIQLVGPPIIEKQLSWLVLRGKGAVWNCPSSTGSDTMTATVTETDKREWSFSASSSASASVLGVGLSAEVVATVAGATTIQEVTTISKQMSAKECRIIEWNGFFEVAEYEADVTFDVERRFAWWTKNMFTGDTVHRSGELWLSCGLQEATLDMRAPIAGYFRLNQTPCPDPECKAIPPMELGWYPPLPPGLQPPVTPGDGGAEEGEGAPGDEAPDEGAPSTGEPAHPTDPEPDPESEPDDAPDEEAPSSDRLGDAPTGALPDPLPNSTAPDAESAS